MNDHRGSSDATTAGPARRREDAAGDGPTADPGGPEAGRPGDDPRVPGLDPEEATVHETLREVRGARDVFARFGIDACCGGELPVAVAAEHHDVDLDRLLDALARADGSG